jgi:hypothetical protein
MVVVPRGPVTVPVRVQALASAMTPTDKVAASREAAMSLVMIFLLDPIIGAGLSVDCGRACAAHVNAVSSAEDICYRMFNGV